MQTYYIPIPAIAPGRAQKNILESRPASELAYTIYHAHSVMASWNSVFTAERNQDTYIKYLNMQIHWLTLKVEYNLKIQISKCIHV